jgi:hypothetical protein
MLLDMASDLLGRQIQLLTQMKIQLNELFITQPACTATIAHAQEFSDATFLIPLEIAPDGIWVNQQRFRYMLSSPTTAEQDDRLKAVGVPLFSSLAVFSAQPNQSARR